MMILIPYQITNDKDQSVFVLYSLEGAVNLYKPSLQ